VNGDPASVAQLDALDRGVGVVDLRGWHLVEVGGADATGWLNDLITADVDALAVGGSVRSLLLGPTGRLRADLLVHRLAASFVLIQGPGQPRPVDDLLGPYVLSSDVTMGAGPEGLAVLPAPDGPWVVAMEPPSGAVTVGAEALESWRIRRGLPRFPPDLDESSLPAEAGLDVPPTIDRVKGCYLGQESVAKVRNAGHPTRVVVSVEAGGSLQAGQAVIADDRDVGEVTSVDGPGGGRLAIARVRWGARDADLTTEAGERLARR
jgi:hypothetical protein